MHPPQHKHLSPFPFYAYGDWQAFSRKEDVVTHHIILYIVFKAQSSIIFLGSLPGNLWIKA